MNISKNKRVNSLTEDEIKKIREFIDENYKVEGDLRREISLNIKRLIDLATYRGTRHKKKLPVRGQRTHCNARTRKGKAIAIAGKKLTPLKNNPMDKTKIKKVEPNNKKIEKIPINKKD